MNNNMETTKTKKTKEAKREEARKIVLEATRAWDVDPVGTIESSTVNDLIERILNL